MRFRTLAASAGVAVAAALAGPATAAHALDVDDPGVTVAAAAFVDHCDGTVDVLTMNITSNPVTLHVTGTKPFTVAAGASHMVAGVHPRKTKLGQLIVRVSEIDQTKRLQELKGQRKVGAPTYVIVHAWQGCPSTPPSAPPASAAPSTPAGRPSPAPSSPAAAPVVLETSGPARHQADPASLPLTGNGVFYWLAAVALVVAGVIAVLLARPRRTEFRT